MKDTLDFTGERFVPEQVREIWYEHWHRYVFALDFVSGLDVLDCACGEGYGSDLLAREAAHVTGVDLHKASIAHAGKRYGSRNNLAFKTGDCAALPFGDNRFDVIVSFETIEHVEEQETMLAEFARVLKPDGFAILSSPDKHAYSEASGFENPYHVRELYREEFIKLAGAHFPAQQLYGQKLLFHSAIWPLEGPPGAWRLASWSKGEVTVKQTPTPPPLYFLLVCARDRRHLPHAPAGLSLFDDTEESVYAHYNAEIRHHIDSGVEFERMKDRIAELEQQLKQQPRPAHWLRRLLGR